MASKGAVWAQHLEAWRASGLTQAGYCRAHGLSLPNFGYWRRKLRQHGTGSTPRGLMPIVAAPPASGAWSVEIGLPNGVRLRVAATLEPSYMVAWVRALGAC